MAASAELCWSCAHNIYISPKQVFFFFPNPGLDWHLRTAAVIIKIVLCSPQDSFTVCSHWTSFQQTALHDFILYRKETINNITIWGHPEKGGIPFESELRYTWLKGNFQCCSIQSSHLLYIYIFDRPEAFYIFLHVRVWRKEYKPVYSEFLRKI